MAHASSRLIIFEGPDGSGKTTLAKGVADAIGALYVHLGPFPGVGEGLARLYSEAIMPAVLGVSHVVMDRSWISEVPYGGAFRNSQDRIGSRARLLDRLALRCEATVVNCCPSWEEVRANWGGKPEYLEKEEQLAFVAAYFRSAEFTHIPTFKMNPLSMTTEEGVRHVLDETSIESSISHVTASRTAGWLLAPVTIVTETPPVRDGDTLYQWPMGQLAPASSSLWLAKQMDAARISEQTALWVPLEDLTGAILNHAFPLIALGDKAACRLYELGRRPDHVVMHPDEWRHGGGAGEYPLITILKEISRG